MTPEQIERHRKRFEELEIKNGNSIDRYDDCQWYWRAAQNNRWIGYLLCAENLEVDLSVPVQFHAKIPCMDELITILESQGIKVKP